MAGPATAAADGAPDRIDAMIDAYAAQAQGGDLMLAAAADQGAQWRTMLSNLVQLCQGDLPALQARMERQVLDLGMAFRLAGEADERSWPLNPVPLLIDAGEWRAIEQGMAQRAELIERIVADIYGAQSLIADGSLPAPLVAGSPHFWRQMMDMKPPKGRYLHFYAADLARDPDGEWRVLADFTRTPTGAGYALENRLAFSRVAGDALEGIAVRRLAPFFAAFRQGLAATCARIEPRIALLTPGRFNQSYAEQAHLARYLGLLLVEGADLAVREGQLYVRTIEGMKRIDALWRRMDASLLDPLSFDAGSRIGVPDLAESMARGQLVVANWPGVGVMEAPAMAAFLPRLAQRLLGADLMLPSVATWWCGQAAEEEQVRKGIDGMAVGSAFGRRLPELGGAASIIGGLASPERRDAILAAMAARPMDYVGQEVVRLSSTPALIDGQLRPRPFTLRVFVTRDPDGNWRIMPGGFARLAAHDDARAALIGEGDLSADVCILGSEQEGPHTLLDSGPAPAIRRVAGTLPSKAADNLYWLARYLERAETTLRLTRSLLGGSIEADIRTALGATATGRLRTTLMMWSAVPYALSTASVGTFCRAAVGAPDAGASINGLMSHAQDIARAMRDRLAVDFWRLLSRPFSPLDPEEGGALAERLGSLTDLFSALAGQAAENMGRSHGWHFHGLGRRLERAVNLCRLARQFAADDAGTDDLSVLLDLADCQISYRTRYLASLSLLPVRDMVLLERQNPRSLAFQIDGIGRHLAAFPPLRDDGMPEPPMQIAAGLSATLAASSAAGLGAQALDDIESRLLALSDAVTARYFLQGADVERAAGMTRLA